MFANTPKFTADLSNWDIDHHINIASIFTDANQFIYCFGFDKTIDILKETLILDDFSEKAIMSTKSSSSLVSLVEKLINQPS